MPKQLFPTRNCNPFWNYIMSTLWLWRVDRKICRMRINLFVFNWMRTDLILMSHYVIVLPDSVISYIAYVTSGYSTSPSPILDPSMVLKIPRFEIKIEVELEDSIEYLKILPIMLQSSLSQRFWLNKFRSKSFKYIYSTCTCTYKLEQVLTIP